MMVVDNKFNFGDFVYLKTDSEQHKRIVSRIVLSKDSIIYEVSFGSEVSSHYCFEMSKDKDVVLATT